MGKKFSKNFDGELQNLRKNLAANSANTQKNCRYTLRIEKLDCALTKIDNIWSMPCSRVFVCFRGRESVAMCARRHCASPEINSERAAARDCHVLGRAAANSAMTHTDSPTHFTFYFFIF